MYDFYIDGMPLPVAPEKFKIKISSQNKAISLINQGEVNVLKSPGLSELEFTVMLPAVQYSFARYESGFKAPVYYLKRFKELKTDKKPHIFLVSRVHPDGALLFDTSMEVSLEEYTITEDAEKSFDVYVDVKLKEYKRYGTKIVNVIESAGEKPVLQKAGERPVTKETPKEYKVQKGDTLWAIAKRELGDGSRYRELAKLNGIATPNKISVGQVIKLG